MLLEHVARFEYHHTAGPIGRSVCDIRVYAVDDALVVVASELDDNPGASITNSAEHAASAVLARYAPDQPGHLIWFERYPPAPVHGPEESIDRVDFSWDPARQILHAPRWMPSSREELERLIGESFPGVASTL